jgi:predicted nucleic acid-binding protein
MRVNRLPLAEALLKMTEAETVIGSLQFPVSSDEVLEECARSGVSAYDAEYLVVARKLQIPLLTHDQRLLGAGTRVARTPEAFLAR